MSNIKYLLLFVFPLTLGSCKKFLDVQPSDQVTQEQLFETNEGVRIAVNGVYRLMSTTELYGKNMTWGFASAISYNYQVYSLPWELYDASQFNWESSTAQTVTEQIWRKSYNVLANVNNIIQEVKDLDSNFFAEKGWEKKMIMGEMYGMRAMVHLDLVRIFSPAPVSGYAGPTIPYVTSYPEYQPARLNMPALFDSIAGDLQRSRELLADVDTVYLRTVFRNATGRIRSNGSWIPLPQGDFFNFRAQRMNYFAATGLLARMYMYKQDFANAELYSKHMYDYQKRNWLQWTQAFNQGQVTDVDYIYTKRPDELMLCFSNLKTFETYEMAIAAGGAGSVFYQMDESYINTLFEGDLDDYRLVGWWNRYNDMRYITWARPRGNSYYADLVTKDQGQLLPALRFTEMYHILIECYARAGKITDAVTILNDVRLRRGAKVKVGNGVTYNQLMEILIKDIVRETLTEGQAFFLFKRLDRDIYNGASSRIMDAEDWFAPLPQSEVAYQL